MRRCPRWARGAGGLLEAEQVVCLLSAFLLPESQRHESSVTGPTAATRHHPSEQLWAASYIRVTETSALPNTGRSSIPGFHVGATGEPSGPSEAWLLWPLPQRKETHGEGSADIATLKLPQVYGVLPFLSDLFLFFIIEHCLHFY